MKPAHDAGKPHGPGLLASPAFWIGGLVSSVIWAAVLWRIHG